ncbi:MAG: YqeG family HAD IIIA-type phosphatase [Synechococcales cyanobacterium T60_A2020_003]|nr:YqeG family HAD IIIA-type phosphatase [Synechococcales cyanobacterium T60_A2020_003]
MSWGILLQPDLILGDSVLSLTLEMLKQNNIKGLVLDVDDTLVHFRSVEVSEEVQQWIQSLKPFVRIWLVSNNMSRHRIQHIATILDVPFIVGARKPSRRKLRQALKAMQLPVAQVAMVGDRLFTDVLAGNRLGMFTVLVEPMTLPSLTDRKSIVRVLEVWLSRILGATMPKQHKYSKLNESTEREI